MILWLGIIAAIGAGFLAYRLSQGPISLDAFKGRIETEIDRRLGEGYTLRFAEAAIENGSRGPGLIVADAYGAMVLREAPEHRLAPATRRAMLLRFALTGADRLHDLADPDRG